MLFSARLLAYPFSLTPSLLRGELLFPPFAPLHDDFFREQRARNFQSSQLSAAIQTIVSLMASLIRWFPELLTEVSR